MDRMIKCNIENELCSIEVNNGNINFAKERLYRRKGFSKIKIDDGPAYLAEQDESPCYVKFTYNPQGKEYKEIINRLKFGKPIIACDMEYIEKYYSTDLEQEFPGGYYVLFTYSSKGTEFRKVIPKIRHRKVFKPDEGYIEESYKTNLEQELPSGYCLFNDNIYVIEENRIRNEKVFRKWGFDAVIKKIPPDDLIYDRFVYNERGVAYQDIAYRWQELVDKSRVVDGKLIVELNSKQKEVSQQDIDYLIKYYPKEIAEQSGAAFYKIDEEYYSFLSHDLFEKERIFREKGFSMVAKKNEPAFSQQKGSLFKNLRYQRFTYNPNGIKYTSIIDSWVKMDEEEICEKDRDDYEYIKKHYASELEQHFNQVSKESNQVATSPESRQIEIKHMQEKQETFALKTNKPANKDKIEHIIVINSDKCIACGTCFTVCDYIEETPEGKAVPKESGIIPFDMEESLKSIILDCPGHAISLQEIKPKSADDIRGMIQSEIRNFTIKKPDRNEFKFDSSKIVVPMVFSPNENCYIYNSYGQAKGAAKEEIDRLMFSQRKVTIQNVLVQYKNQKLRRYYVYEQTNDNLYYQLERSIKESIMKIIDQIRIYKPDVSIPLGLTEFSVKPNQNYIDWFTKNYFEEGEAIRVLRELSGEYYSLSWYTDRCDIDDTEEYVGTGLFGGDKYKTKYAFNHLNDAFKEIEKDIKEACSSVISSDSVDMADTLVSSIIDNCMRELKPELNKKAQILEKLL